MGRCAICRLLAELGVFPKGALRTDGRERMSESRSEAQSPRIHFPIPGYELAKRRFGLRLDQSQLNQRQTESGAD